MKWSGGLFSRRTEINGFRLQVLRTQGLHASINATASISSNLDKAFPFNTNHGKPLISVLLLNKPQDRLSWPSTKDRIVLWKLAHTWRKRNANTLARPALRRKESQPLSTGWTELSCLKVIGSPGASGSRVDLPSSRDL